MTNTMDTVRNGVDTATLFATLDAVKGQPEAAKFQFRATSEWVSGTHSRMSINGFYGVGAEQTREQTFVVEGDHPAILVGGDQAPTPAELLLSALAATVKDSSRNEALDAVVRALDTLRADRVELWLLDEHGQTFRSSRDAAIRCDGPLGRLLAGEPRRRHARTSPHARVPGVVRRRLAGQRNAPAAHARSRPSHACRQRSL